MPSEVGYKVSRLLHSEELLEMVLSCFSACVGEMRLIKCSLLFLPHTPFSPTPTLGGPEVFINHISQPFSDGRGSHMTQA